MGKNCRSEKMKITAVVFGLFVFFSRGMLVRLKQCATVSVKAKSQYFLGVVTSQTY